MAHVQIRGGVADWYWTADYSNQKDKKNEERARALKAFLEH